MRIACVVLVPFRLSVFWCMHKVLDVHTGCARSHTYCTPVPFSFLKVGSTLWRHRSTMHTQSSLSNVIAYLSSLAVFQQICKSLYANLLHVFIHVFNAFRPCSRLRNVFGASICEVITSTILFRSSCLIVVSNNFVSKRCLGAPKTFVFLFIV